MKTEYVSQTHQRDNGFACLVLGLQGNHVVLREEYRGYKERAKAWRAGKCRVETLQQEFGAVQ